MPKERERGPDRQMAESQIIELQNVRVLLDEARSQIGSLSEHRHAPRRLHQGRVEGGGRPVTRPLVSPLGLGGLPTVGSFREFHTTYEPRGT